MNLTPNMPLASRLELQVFPDLLAKLKLLENMNDITENGRTRPDGLMNWPERPERHRDSAGPVIPDYLVLCIRELWRWVRRCGLVLSSQNDIFHQDYMSSDDVRLVDRRWRIGEAGGITREDVIVVGAINVSVGSWMPHLATQSKCGLKAHGSPSCACLRCGFLFSSYSTFNRHSRTTSAFVWYM